MRIQITIIKDIDEVIDGERLYALTKERLSDLTEIRYGASINQQVSEPPPEPE